MIVHPTVSMEAVSNGRHRGCGKRVAILKSDYNPDDLYTRRKLQQQKITRWYQLHQAPSGEMLEIGILPHYPDPADYVKELRKRFFG